MNRNCIVRADRLLIPDRLVDLVDGEDFSGVRESVFVNWVVSF